MEPTAAEKADEETAQAFNNNQALIKKQETLKKRQEKKERGEDDPLSKANLWKEVEEAFKKYDLDSDGRLSC